MLPSLSVRIAEGFLSKEESLIDLDRLAGFARDAGFGALCLRASQVGVHSTPECIRAAAATLARHRLVASMVTGDFAIVYNDDRGPEVLRRISAYLDLAQTLGAPLIRVALRNADDIPRARLAADAARERGLRLVHQCHIQSLFETVDGIESTLRAIGRDNFGLIYEAANLELCGQDFGLTTVRRLAPWIFNVYLQNQRIHPGGAVTLETWCRGPVRFDLLAPAAPGGIDFSRVFDALAAIGYDGPVTSHQSAPADGRIDVAARQTAGFLSRWVPLAIPQTNEPGQP